MSLYLVNTLLGVGVLIMLTFALWLIRRWRTREIRSIDIALSEYSREFEQARATHEARFDLLLLLESESEYVRTVEQAQAASETRFDRILETKNAPRNTDEVPVAVSAANLFWFYPRYVLRMVAADTLFKALNLITTVVALIPLGIAVYNLIINHQHQALEYNLVSLGTVVVTKGGLFLLTLVLVPFLKAVPIGMGSTTGGIILHRLWKRIEKRQSTKPTE